VPTCISCSNPMQLRFSDRVPQHWRGSRCGLECISPQPDDSVLAEIYNEKYYLHYRTAIDQKVVRAMKRATYAHQLRRLPSPESFGADHRLLDCGAATGFLAELAMEQGWDAFAVELSEFGSQSCAKLLGPERIYCGQPQDASFLTNPNNQFEVITMFDFIEHVRDPIDLINWAKDRLVPGGALLMTTPRTGSISWRAMGRQWFHYTSEHLWYFGPDSIKALLAKVGFDRLEIHPALKSVTLNYALTYYSRDPTHNRFVSPIAAVLNSTLPEFLKRQRAWFYLGEMVVLGRA
jgi:SAM-dependent methyltransferase